jgi:AraC-like DNA-binding protein
VLVNGFESLSHFYRVFRRRLEETPRGYRRRSQAALGCEPLDGAEPNVA